MDTEQSDPELLEEGDDGIPRRARGRLILLSIVGSIAPPLATALFAFLRIFADNRELERMDLAIFYVVVLAACAVVFVPKITQESSRATGVYAVGAAAMCVTAWFAFRWLEVQNDQTSIYPLLVGWLAPVASGFIAASLVAMVSSDDSLFSAESFDNGGGRPALAKWSMALIVMAIADLWFLPGPESARVLIALVGSAVGLFLALASWPNSMAGPLLWLALLVLMHLFRLALW